MSFSATSGNTRLLAERAIAALRGGPNALTRALTRPLPAFALLGGVYLLLLIAQVALQTGGRNDDAELLLFGQDLQLGYDPKNPPLIVWAAWAVEQVLGPGLPAVRFTVLGTVFLTYLFVWLAARTVVTDRRLAVLAGLAPATLLYVAWNPLINLSHTLALGCLCAATLAAGLAFLARPGTPRALLLGLAVGLGLLTKYNFAVFLSGLALAMLAVPQARRTLLARQSLAAIPVVLAVAGPHYLWLAGQHEAAAAILETKWGLNDQVPWLSGVLEGLGALLQGSLSFLLPMLALVPLVFWYAFVPGRRTAASEPAENGRDARRRVAGLAHLFMLLLMGGATLFGATQFATHHFFFLIGLPVWLFAVIDRTPVRTWSLNLFSLAVVGCLLAVLLSYFGWIEQNARKCSKCGLLMPYETYAEGLRTAGFDPGTVLILGPGDFLPAEQMRPWMPEARFLRPEGEIKRFFTPAPNAVPGDCAIVWLNSRFPEFGARLRSEGVAGYPPLPETAVFGRIEGTLPLYGRAAPAMSYVLVEGGLGTCR
ncbi:hypothetical protein AY599_09735 [Leptolyngbya valderiana BDU 20041]|nr:hypothetical protein AY599_09735 [Leptolyngbya valderiana BDU 20041]